MIKAKVDIVRAIPLPPISLKKGPIPICPPNKKVKKFFDKIGSTVEIRNEKLSINFWSTSGMMASYYELLKVMSEWLIKKGIIRAGYAADLAIWDISHPCELAYRIGFNPIYKRVFGGKI